MSQEQFRILHEPLRKMTAVQVRSLKKDDAVVKLNEALEALELAETIMMKQSDTILATTNELVQACADNRKTRAVFQSEEDGEKTYAATVKTSKSYPIILKNDKNGLNFKCNETRKQISKALCNVNVNSTRVTRQGDLIVNLPNPESSEVATNNLKEVFKSKVCIEPAKKLLPKLTVVGLPFDYDPDNLATDAGDKDSTLKGIIARSTFEVLKTWEMKNDSGEIISKKVALKVSPEVRNYIIMKKEGYLFIDLIRCKVYDRLIVTQCYHCYDYHHIKENCPHKTKKPTCGKCAEAHATVNCRSKSEKCVNCTRARPNEPNNHCAFAYKCPTYEHEKKILQQKTDYDGEKNL